MPGRLRPSPGDRVAAARVGAAACINARPPYGDTEVCWVAEIDVNTTYVACSQTCCDEIIDLPDLEALAIDAG